MKLNDKSSQLEIKTVTWQKDSHQLFDYESSQVTIQKNTVKKNCLIYRKSRIIIIKDQDSYILESDFQSDFINYRLVEEIRVR